MLVSLLLFFPVASLLFPPPSHQHLSQVFANPSVTRESRASLLGDFFFWGGCFFFFFGGRVLRWHCVIFSLFFLPFPPPPVQTPKRESFCRPSISCPACPCAFFLPPQWGEKGGTAVRLQSADRSRRTTSPLTRSLSTGPEIFDRLPTSETLWFCLKGLVSVRRRSVCIGFLYSVFVPFCLRPSSWN